MPRSASAGPHILTNYKSANGNSINGGAATENDLSHIFPTIRIIYTGSDVNIGGGVGDVNVGMAGQFVLVVNTGSDNLDVGAGGILLGGGDTKISLPGYFAQLFMCVGQASGNTAWINIGGAQRQASF